MWAVLHAEMWEDKLVVSNYIIHACRKFGFGFLVHVSTALLIRNQQVAKPEYDYLKVVKSCIPANIYVGMDFIPLDKYLKDEAL